MTLRIIFPSNPIDTESEDICTTLSNIEPNDMRKIVFFDEHIQGYIIFSGPLDQQKDFIRLVMAILPLDILGENDPLSYAASESKVELDLGHDSLVHASESISIWKFELPVTYPRKRLSNPQLYIHCSLVDTKD